MRDFKNSQEFAFRRLVRDAVRKSPDFTKSDRDVTLALLNVWFHHKGSGKGFIHPGREMLAKRAGCTVKTVSRTLAKLRAIGAITALNSLKGNRHEATRYVVSEAAILVFCGHDWVDQFARNVPSRSAEMSHLGRDKMSHCNIPTSKASNDESLDAHSSARADDV